MTHVVSSAYNLLVEITDAFSASQPKEKDQRKRLQFTIRFPAIETEEITNSTEVSTVPLQLGNLTTSEQLSCDPNDFCSPRCILIILLFLSERERRHVRGGFPQVVIIFFIRKFHLNQASKQSIQRHGHSSKSNSQQRATPLTRICSVILAGWRGFLLLLTLLF